MKIIQHTGTKKMMQNAHRQTYSFNHSFANSCEYYI